MLQLVLLAFRIFEHVWVFLRKREKERRRTSCSPPMNSLIPLVIPLSTHIWRHSERKMEYKINSWGEKREQTTFILFLYLCATIRKTNSKIFVVLSASSEEISRRIGPFSTLGSAPQTDSDQERKVLLNHTSDSGPTTLTQSGFTKQLVLLCLFYPLAFVSI